MQKRYATPTCGTHQFIPVPRVPLLIGPLQCFNQRRPFICGSKGKKLLLQYEVFIHSASYNTRKPLSYEKPHFVGASTWAHMEGLQRASVEAIHWRPRKQSKRRAGSCSVGTWKQREQREESYLINLAVELLFTDTEVQFIWAHCRQVHKSPLSQSDWIEASLYSFKEEYF